MICNICHKEFGNGVACQHCGIDRVAALGNYQGYSPHANDVNKDLPRTQSPVEPPRNFVKDVDFIVCYSCAEVIPGNSEYCPKCGRSLYHVCPHCKKKYSSQYSICQYCGTNRVDFYAQEEKIRRARQERERIQAEKERQERLRQAELIEAEKKQKELQNKLNNQVKDIVEDIKRNRDGGRKKYNKINNLFLALLCVLPFVHCIPYWSDRQDLIIPLFLGAMLFGILGSIIWIPFYHYKMKKIEKQNVLNGIDEYILAHPDDIINRYLKDYKNNLALG